MASDPFFAEIPWDPRSEQPIRIRDDRPWRTRVRYAWPEYLKCAGLALCKAAPITLRHWRLAKGHVPKGWVGRTHDVRDFMGLAIALHSCPPDRLADEIEELGVKHLLLRIPAWEVDRLGVYRRFLDRMADREFAVAIMQNRTHVRDLDDWRESLYRIISTCWPRVKTFQIGQGMNRTKWGCFGIDEFLRLASVAEELRPRYPGIKFVGPGALDFEPLAIMRGVSHRYPIRWDISGSALYVDRRGSPRSRQYKLFDLKHKIYNTVACVAGSSRAGRRLWITEVNWPLKGQGKYSPSGSRTSIGEEPAARYLGEYYEDAWSTGLVERVYWWQLVANGFGLIDVDDSGRFRRRPSYYVYRNLLRNGIGGSGGDSHPDPDETPWSSADGSHEEAGAAISR